MNPALQKGLLIGGAGLLGLAAYFTLKPAHAAPALPGPEPYRPPVPPPGPLPSATAPRVGTAYVKAPSGLMLRSGPGSANPPVLASAMPYGVQVQLLGGAPPGSAGAWAQVSYAGKTGYASTDWLSATPPAPSGAAVAPPPPPQPVYTPPSWQVPVETTPGTETYKGAATQAVQTYEGGGIQALASAAPAGPPPPMTERFSSAGIGAVDDDPYRWWVDIHG